MLKVIKDRNDYEAALEEIEQLIDLDPADGTNEEDRLELLRVLIKDYEARNTSHILPDPIEAIKFRMEQQNLSPRDLIPFIGNRSKVSEILSGKRSLTLSMIRALHSGLGIPANILLQHSEQMESEESMVDWDRFPIKEMLKRKYVDSNVKKIEKNPEQFVRNFFSPLGQPTTAIGALYRRTENIRSARTMDQYALVTWSARIMIKALTSQGEKPYHHGSITPLFMKRIAQLSADEKRGPLLAVQLLRDHGIPLIIEPHFSKTYLDGAAILMKDGRPAIGLTLRHDRIDNFWFCLMHELAHIYLHFDKGFTQFFDDLDLSSQNDPREREADELATNILIPQDDWDNSPASRLKSPQAAQLLAKKLNIHPAIVAGRMRKEFNAYRLLSTSVGHGQVRNLFTDITWDY